MGEEKKIQSDTENVDEETIKLFLLVLYWIFRPKRRNNGIAFTKVRT